MQIVSTERTSILTIDKTTENKRNELENARKNAETQYTEENTMLTDMKTKKATLANEIKQTKSNQTSLSSDIVTENKKLLNEIGNSKFNSRQNIEEALISFDDRRKSLKIKNNIKEKEIQINTLSEKLEKDLTEQEKSKTGDHQGSSFNRRRRQDR